MRKFLAGVAMQIAHRADSGNTSEGIRTALRAWGEANPD